MILSHRYKFIFLKTMKTAGSSIEIALSRYCGEGDILTPFGPDEEVLRDRQDYQGAQNYWMPYHMYSRHDWLNLLRGRRKMIHHHIRAERVRQLVGEKVWGSYVKLSVERNPWDKAISFYYYSTRDQAARPPLIEFLRQARDKHTLSNFPIYSIGDVVAADYVMRFEKLDDEMTCLQELLKLPEKPDLPRANASSRADRRHYSQVLTDEERELIAEVCAREIKLFGYQFETLQ